MLSALGALWLVRMALGHLGVHLVDLRGLGDILAMSLSSPRLCSEQGWAAIGFWHLARQGGISRTFRTAFLNLPLGAIVAVQGRGFFDAVLAAISYERIDC